MRKILVTGGAGQVGSCLVDKLIENDENFVVIIDNFLTGKKHNLPSSKNKNFKFITCDVNNFRDISTIVTAYNFDYIFHYAAVVGVKRTTDHPSWVLEDIHGIENILNLAKNTGVKRVFFSSSSEVYGELIEHPQNELTTPLNSRLPYAVVKNVGESYLKAYKNDFDLDYTIFRFFNTYGPKQSLDFVMSRFVKNALKNDEIQLYGDGMQTRTFCFIDDNIEATTNCLYQDLMVNDTINIGSDNEITILELAKTIINITDSKSKIVHLPALKEGDMSRRKPDIAKMKLVLNRDLTSLETGINQMIEFGKKYRHW
ncbi:MAG: NAD-dependent epimerase/dehydratase family protein [Bacteroidetes bacterium]|nr:NAD-dependent epimerase/dehydratase family protein [Bacteroidota bacterium]